MRGCTKHPCHRPRDVDGEITGCLVLCRTDPDYPDERRERMPTRSFTPQPAAGGRIHAYARVSTPDQAEADRTSLDEQVRIIHEHVARYRAGARIVIWREEGFSGATPLAQRPVAKEMLADLQPGDTVVCTRVDRLSR